MDVEHGERLAEPFRLGSPGQPVRCRTTEGERRDHHGTSAPPEGRRELAGVRGDGVDRCEEGVAGGPPLEVDDDQRGIDEGCCHSHGSLLGSGGISRR